MSGVSQFSRTWFDWAAAASWELALLVCLIAAITFLLRDASPRLRYGLWMLVLVKALLPPTLATVWGVGAWGVAPVVEHGCVARIENVHAALDSDAAAPSSEIDAKDAVDAGSFAADISAESLLMFVWAAGCLSIWIAVAWRYRRLTRTTDAMRRIDEGPLRVELERLAARFSVRTVPELFATEQAASPMLVGVLRPKIVLPESIFQRLSPPELRMILAHELVHWRRRDTWVGWLQVLVQGVFWFHPLVWLANARIRHERECACDETVLREASCERDGYGETIIRVLTASRGRSLVMANMAGVFERGSRLQTRLEEIMNFDPNKRRFGWLSYGVLIAAALVLLPMAAPRAGGENAAVADETTMPNSNANGNEQSKETRPKTNWPTIVSTNPKIGAIDVDPSLKEISVTFDRDMDVGGYSWTGGGEFYPPSPPDAGPVWTDKRTCVLPVRLEKGAFYRVGINSTSHQNFRSAAGVAAPTAAIYFATAAAKGSVAAKVREPKVVAMAPKNGAEDVDAGLKVLRVTFNVPMDPGGFSWTGGGPTFPTIPEGQKPRWSRDGKTCTLPVELKAGTRYELGLNSVSHKNFASKWGVPLAPVRYQFKTAGEATEGVVELSAEVAAAGKPPGIVKMVPENGAKDVDPAITEILVVFDQPMAGGFSWTGGGEQFPTIPDGKKPAWSADKKSCTLPVELKPNWSYLIGLNSPRSKNFASKWGVPLSPVRYRFQTGAGR